MLILSQTTSNQYLAAGAICHLFFHGLDVEIWPKSGVPHHPPELFIHLGGAIGSTTLNMLSIINLALRIQSFNELALARGAHVGGPTWGPKWVGPRGAQSGWAHVGPTWAQARNLGPKNKPRNKNSQNQNPFCPKCWQGSFMPEKCVPAPFGALPAHFLRGPEKSKNCANFCLFSLVGQWALFTRCCMWLSEGCLLYTSPSPRDRG